MEDIIFKAKIIEKNENKKGKYIILNHTEFYPDGKGGQLGDRGTIDSSKVVKVDISDNKIFHFVDEFPSAKSNKEVTCIISGERRRNISIHHTAQHILSGAFFNLFDIETVSFHMEENYCTIDLSTPNISQEEIEDAEELANKIVMANVPVRKYFVNKEELAKLPIRKKHAVTGKTRIIEIPDFDISMCGGTHVNYTGEVGVIKVTKYERVKKTFQRIRFTTGINALKDYQNKTKILSTISNFLTTGENELIEKIKNLLKESKHLQKETVKLKNELLRYMAKDLIKESKRIGKFDVLIKEIKDYPKEDIITLSKKCISEKPLLTILYRKDNETEIAISKSDKVNIDLMELKEELSKRFKVRGGGNNKFLILQINEDEGFKEFILDFIQRN